MKSFFGSVLSTTGFLIFASSGAHATPIVNTQNHL